MAREYFSKIILFIPLFLFISSVESIINPPKFAILQNPPINNFSNISVRRSIREDIPPYKVTINDGFDIEVGLNTKSQISVNLNRALPLPITVRVTSHSQPGLIRFEGHGPIENSIDIFYEANTFGDKIVVFDTSAGAGHAEIACKVIEQPKNETIDDSLAFISVNIHKSLLANTFIIIIGWLYFLAWTLSFYFQVILNYQRKSVVGLSFDFLALNLLGFSFYTIYNFTLKFSNEARRDYYQRYAYHRIPVEYNDLFFAAHAFVLTLITVIQCFIYERAQQKVSIATGAFVGLTTLVGTGLFIAHLTNVVLILDAILFLSYVKLATSVIKYTPQAYLNYSRKATTGWSIHNILLDFIGGSLSIAQMFLIAYNYNDWVSILGNFAKFGLGVVSICFDILFVVQHYFLYKQGNSQFVDPEDSIPGPVTHESIISASYSGLNQQRGALYQNGSDVESLDR